MEDRLGKDLRLALPGNVSVEAGAPWPGQRSVCITSMQLSYSNVAGVALEAESARLVRADLAQVFYWLGQSLPTSLRRLELDH